MGVSGLLEANGDGLDHEAEPGVGNRGPKWRIDDGGDSSMIVGEDEGDKELEWVGREKDRMVADVDASFWGGKQKKKKREGFWGLMWRMRGFA